MRGGVGAVFIVLLTAAACAAPPAASPVAIAPPVATAPPVAPALPVAAPPPASSADEPSSIGDLPPLPPPDAAHALRDPSPPPGVPGEQEGSPFTFPHGRPASESSRTPGALGDFDRNAAAAALSVDLRSCRRAEGPTGAGHARLTFRPSGKTADVELDAGPFAGTATGTCVLERFRAVRVPPFAGGEVRLGKTFAID